MKQLKRAIAAITAVCMLVCSGCSSTEVPTSKETEPGMESGYLEEKCGLPEGGGKISTFQCLEDGSLAFLKQNETTRKWGIQLSKDNGETWEEKPVPWLSSQGTGFMLFTSEFRKDGSLRVTSLEMLPEEIPDSLEDITLTYTVSDLNGQGELEKQMEVAFPGNEILLKERTTESGDLLYETYRGLWQMDGSTGKLKYQYEKINDRNSDTFDFVCVGDDLIVNQGPELLTYNLKNGQRTQQFDTGMSVSDNYSLGAMQSRGKARLLTLSKDGKSLFFCDQNGIAAHLLDGSLVEQMMKSSGSSLNLPTRMPFCMAVHQEEGENTFFVLFEEGESYYLARYVYSEEIPTEKTILSVYYLDGFNDGRIRQTIGQFELEHPEIQIKYTIGLPVTDGMGAYESHLSDAIRTLSTELLAGKGPDILILDRLPVESYLEKGILMDLSDLAKEYTETGRWIPTVVNSMKEKDGKLYGIPASFKIPMMLGDPETVDSIHSFPELADWAERAWKADQTVRPFEQLSWDYLMRLFYPICQTAWADDPAENKDKIAEFMRAAKQLDDLEVPDDIDFRNDLDAGAWYTGKTQMAIGEMRSVWELAVISSILARGDKQGKLALLQLDGMGYYSPQKTVGVNANSPRKEQAVEFLKTMLSEQVQKYEFYDGLPVNQEVLRAQLQSTEEVYTGELVVEGLGETRFLVDSNWPNEAMANQFQEQISQLSIPLIGDDTADILFGENIIPYWEEGAPLEECVENYIRMTELRDAE